jgi:hypothetical protein
MIPTKMTVNLLFIFDYVRIYELYRPETVRVITPGIKLANIPSQVTIYLNFCSNKKESLIIYIILNSLLKGT